MRFSGRIAPADPKCALFVAAERRLVLTVSCLLCYFTATIPIDWISSAKLLHRLLDEVAWQELLFRLVERGGLSWRGTSAANVGCCHDGTSETDGSQDGKLIGAFCLSAGDSS